jgi:hypothetical protein
VSPSNFIDNRGLLAAIRSTKPGRFLHHATCNGRFLETNELQAGFFPQFGTEKGPATFFKGAEQKIIKPRINPTFPDTVILRLD